MLAEREQLEACLPFLVAPAPGSTEHRLDEHRRKQGPLAPGPPYLRLCNSDRAPWQHRTSAR